MFDGVPAQPPAAYAHCFVEAARAYSLPASLLPAIAHIENGRVGQSTMNKNGTRDHGIMQINDVWVARLNKLFGVTAVMMRDDPCASIKVAGYILRYEINRANGDFWKGVGRYHSNMPSRHTKYIQKVFVTATFKATPYQVAVN